MATLTDAEREARLLILDRAEDLLKQARREIDKLPDVDRRRFDRAFYNSASARPGIITRVNELQQRYLYGKGQ